MPMSPVGLTSRWIAAARAFETEIREPLFRDALARDLAGDAGFAMMAAMRAAVAAVEFTGPDPYLSIRTRFFDDAILRAVGERSIRHVVLLAAGMDARAFRLQWPAGTVVFEVDREDVFDQKDAVLERLDARPSCDRRVVRADVTGEWIAPLLEAGFDRALPAALLVEGLLMYLDAPAVDRVMTSIRTLAAEGSWLGLDLVNDELLASPYFASYLAALREAGCPWQFSVPDPETWLAGYGWRGRAVTPGEPEASYGRWPYAAMPRALPNLPRTFLVTGERSEAASTAARTESAADAAVTASAIRYPVVREGDLVASFGIPGGEGPFPAVLALGGSDGGIPEYFTDLLVAEGFACLAQAFFGTDGLQGGLIEVPLERIERGLRWVALHPRCTTRNGRVPIIAASRGAELALLLAATYPDLVGPVAAYTPSHVVWPGIEYTMNPGPPRSSWTIAGKPLPFVPYVEGVRPTVSERGMAVVEISDRALDNAEAVRAAAIPIERAAGPLLLVSGGDDRVWAAARMCRVAVERMQEHGRGTDVRHLYYPEAGHGLFPYTGPSGVVARPFMRLDLGGTLAAMNAAHADAWPQVVRHLRSG